MTEDYTSEDVLNARFDNVARERVIFASRALICAVYNRWYRSLDFDDALQTGYAAATEALDQFQAKTADAKEEWGHYATTKILNALSAFKRSEAKHWGQLSYDYASATATDVKVCRLVDYYCLVCSKPYGREASETFLSRGVCGHCWQGLEKFKASTGVPGICPGCCGRMTSINHVPFCPTCEPREEPRCYCCGRIASELAAKGGKAKAYLNKGRCNSCDRQHWRMIKAFGSSSCPLCNTMLVSRDKTPHCPSCGRNTLERCCE